MGTMSKPEYVKKIEKIQALQKELRPLYDDCGRGHRGYGLVQAALRDALDGLARAVYHLQRMDGQTPEKPRQTELSEGPTQWKDLEQNHESFGVISLSRVTGRRRLVGSMLDASPSCMEIVIRRASRYIDERLHTERYHGRHPVLTEISLSPHQWAEFISSPGQGDGIPCTIRYHDGVKMAEVPPQVKSPLETIAKQTRDQSLKHETEASETFHNATKVMRDAILGSKMTKKLQKELLALLDGIDSCEFAPRATAAWGVRRIAEATEEAQNAAKVEIEAIFTNKIMQLGSDELKEQLMLAADEPDKGNGSTLKSLKELMEEENG